MLRSVYPTGAASRSLWRRALHLSSIDELARDAALHSPSMHLSTEALVAIVTLATTCPSSALAVWKLYRHCTRDKAHGLSVPLMRPLADWTRLRARWPPHRSEQLCWRIHRPALRSRPIPHRPLCPAPLRLAVRSDLDNTRQMGWGSCRRGSTPSTTARRSRPRASARRPGVGRGGRCGARCPAGEP